MWVQVVIFLVYFLVFSMGLSGFFRLSLSCFFSHFGIVVSDLSFAESSGYFWGFLDDKMISEMGRNGGEAQRMPYPCVCVSKVLRFVVGNYMGVCVLSKHKLCVVQAWIMCWHVVDKSKIGYLGNTLEPNTSPFSSIHHSFLTLTNNQQTVNTLNKMLGYLDKLIKT